MIQAAPHPPTRDSSIRVNRFIPAQRIRYKPQFDAVYQRGSKLGDNCFLILYRFNDQAHARLGLSVSAKTVGNAVNRNRIKRVVRDSFRKVAAQLPPIDIVVNTRQGARHSDNAMLRQRLEAHWQSVVTRCATSS